MAYGDKGRFLVLIFTVLSRSDNTTIPFVDLSRENSHSYRYFNFEVNIYNIFSSVKHLVVMATSETVLFA